MDSMGNFYDLHLGPWGQNLQHDYGEGPNNLAWQFGNPASCPSIGVLLVRSLGNHTRHDDMIALMCSQKVQQVQVGEKHDNSEYSSF